MDNIVEVKRETYIMLKPVILGYDVNYCSYSNFEVVIRTYYFLFFSIVQYKITLFKD